MAVQSAGILPYRRRDGEFEVLLVHPGGPYWRNRDRHAWSMPKGEVVDDEPSLDAARREFREETGFEAEGPFLELGTVKQSSSKTVHVWAVEGDWDPASLKSNTFEMEWPPNSGRRESFPEVDRAAWFSLGAAREQIHKGQSPVLDRLVGKLREADRGDTA